MVIKNKKSLLLCLLFLVASWSFAQDGRHWQCDIYGFKYDMTLYFTLECNGLAIPDLADYEVAAFVGDGYLRVRSNVKDGENVTFKIFHNKTSQILSVIETISFNSESMLGLPSSPYTLSFKGFLKGDSNGDDEINVGDIVEIIKDMLHKTTSQFVKEAADVNGDNKVDATDILLVANIIMGGDTNASGTGGAASTDNLTIEKAAVSAGGTRLIAMELKNTSKQYVAFQFDLVLPEGISIAKNEKGEPDVTLNAERKEDHSLTVQLQEDKSIRFMAYSMGDKAYKGTGGALVYVMLEAKDGLSLGDKEAAIKSQVFTDVTGEVSKWNDTAFKITVVEPSTVTAKSYERVYGEANPEFGYEVKGGALDGTPVITCDATEKSPVGTYDIIVKRGTETDNSVTYVKGTLTISPKTVNSPSITLTPTSYIFDGSEKKPTVTVADGGTTIPSEEYTVSYSNNTNVGTATVTITDKTGGNYTVSGSTTFSIVAADGSLTPPTGKTGLTYTGAAQDLITAGSSTTGTLQYSLDGTNYGTAIPKGTDAKEYTVYYKVAAKAGYKDVAPASFKVAIAKTPLKVKAGTYTRKQGEENPEFTLEYKGFKNNETEDVLTKKPTVTTTATKNSPAGKYPVTVSGAVAANYEITYVDGMLTVVKKKGDVNGDGDVDQEDIDAIVSYLFGDITDGFDEEAADVNVDQKVNVADIVLLVKMIEK